MFYLYAVVATVPYVWFHATGAAKWPITTVARLNKKCWMAHNWAEVHNWAHYYSLHNWISHWCKVSYLHWTTLMRDTLDITGAGCEYDFIWLYTGYSILVRWNDTTQVYNSGVTDGVQGCEPLPWQARCKNWATFCLYFGIQYFLVFSKLFFAFFVIFSTVVFRWFRVLIYRNPHPDTMSCLIFFLNICEGPPTVASGPLSATFLTLAKTYSYATGLQLNFDEYFFTRLLNPRWMLTIVAIGNPEWHVRKASHCGSKQQ